LREEYKRLATTDWHLFPEELIASIKEDKIVSALHSVISLKRTFFNKKSLIIFDNAPVGFLKNLMMQLPPSTDILVTSREPGWGTEIHLSDKDYCLTPKEGVEILEQWIDARRYKENEAEKIVARFNNLPVLIAQAGHYISKSSTMTMKDYLPLFESKKSEILNGGQTSNQNIDFIVALDMIMQQLKRDEITLKLLRNCAYLPGKNIPTSLLMKILNMKDSDKLNRSLSALGTLLIQSEDKVTIHEVFQDIIVEKNPPQSKDFLTIARGALNSPEYDEFFLTNPFKSLSIYEEGLKEAEKSHSEDIAAFCNKLGKINTRLERYEDALHFYRKSLNFNKKKFGVSHPNTATSYNNVGDTLLTLTRHKEALEYLKSALEIRINVYGEYHAETSESYNDLGGAYFESGLYNEAFEKLQKGLEIRKKVHGEFHTATAKSYSNLGAFFLQQKKYEEALDYFQKNLDIQKKVMGENHSATAIAYNNVGSTLQYMGKLSEALKNHEKSLEIHRKVYGEHHSTTAINHSNMGSIYQAQGQLKKALKSYRIALEIQREIWGDDHIDTASTYKKIGVALEKLDRDSESLENHRKAIAIIEKIRGEEHPENKTYYSTIAIVLKKLGGQEEAQKYEKKASTNSTSI